MSRIGRQPIAIPDKVKVAVEGQFVRIEGPRGKSTVQVAGPMKVTADGKQITVARDGDSREARSLHGLTRSLLSNMLSGVTQGYQRTLEIAGVGFKAEVKGKAVHFSIGFSHPIVFPLPEGVTAEWKEVKVADKQGEVVLKSHDKDLLGRTAAKVRGLRPAEPYKGKGIKYAEETIRRKVGKTGAA
ncbi:MAG TPA: 50S ribosomal protein L6 [Myxococcales bacterium]|nr:50S ribosomal protein L6 [Myxococcales bacterium]